MRIYYVYPDYIAFHDELKDARHTMIGRGLINDLGTPSSQGIRSRNGNSRL